MMPKINDIVPIEEFTYSCMITIVPWLLEWALAKLGHVCGWFAVSQTTSILVVTDAMTAMIPPGSN